MDSKTKYVMELYELKDDGKKLNGCRSNFTDNIEGEGFENIFRMAFDDMIKLFKERVTKPKEV